MRFLDLKTDLIIEFDTLSKSQSGICEYSSDEAVIYISRGLSKTETTKAIFHELVHVKQYEEKKLEDGEYLLWFGELYNTKTYNEYPWEIEAYRLEEEIFFNFNESKIDG